MTIKRYNRKTTGVTISIFYEQYLLNKYNFEPPYQRDYNVWKVEQQSFFIDTLMKNFPIPPIFLEQKINSKTGKTTYDLIDGKQRLTAIVNFIENKIKLPETFGNDYYGNEKLANKTFKELQELATEDADTSDFIDGFWGYVLSVEYIENPDSKVVDNIFDRLNRGGVQLNEQELRRANYYDTIMYNDIESLRNDTFISALLSNTKKHRLQDVSFITELYLLVLLNSIIDGSEDQIDNYFSEMVDDIDQEKSNAIISQINNIKKIVQAFNLDYKKYKISGTSHLYAIWYLAYFMNKNNIKVTPEFSGELIGFFEDLRGEKLNKNTQDYHKSMQSGSKSKSSRRKRIIALLDHFGFEYDSSKL